MEKNHKENILVNNITINNITIRYEDKTVFHRFSCVIEGGKITCIMGSSGCGKTTLVSAIMGLIKPEEGQILGLNGKKISAVFQENRLCQSLTVLENMKLVCDKKTSEQAIQETLQRLGIPESEGLKPDELSGGMQRRVAIARALLAQYDILILDEPFKGLDESTKLQVIQYVKEKSEGKTVIVVTHDSEEVSLLEGQILKL